MAKVVLEYESRFDVGDVVIFEKDNELKVGVIEGFYIEDGIFWYNIRISPTMVYTYSNKGDIQECHIMCKIESGDGRRCRRKITGETL